MKYLAIDLGAESGRAVLGTLEDSRLHIEEIHRFSNGPVEREDGLHWDVNALFAHIKTGLRKYVEKHGSKLDGISVDSWGVDYVLLDENGEAISDPFHYRDKRTNNSADELFKTLSREEVFNFTGIQFMPFNTLYQLYSARESDDLTKANSFLMMADYFNYKLCGIAKQEFSMATTSQMYDSVNKKWADELIEKSSIPSTIFPKVVPPASVLGEIKAELAEETGLENGTEVIASASHDTACAVAASPLDSRNSAYLSSGTWSLLGLELDKPIINSDVMKANFTNEGGAENTTRFLANISGLWLLQQCNKKWDMDYGDIVNKAEAAVPLVSVVNTADPRFISPDDMEQAINDYCNEKGQPAPADNDIGAVARCIFESLAFKYRQRLEELEQLTGKTIDIINIVGGGSKNSLLCQLTADATGRVVKTGSVEATAIGNILLQAKAAGVIDSMKELRDIVANSFEIIKYAPSLKDEHEKAYQNYTNMIKQTVER